MLVNKDRAVASLTVPSGQEFTFPLFFLNFDQFFLFFLKLDIFSSSFWFSGWASRPPGKALATPLNKDAYQTETLTEWPVRLPLSKPSASWAIDQRLFDPLGLYTVKTPVLNQHQSGFNTGPIWNGVNLTPLRCYFNTFRSRCWNNIEGWWNNTEKC